MIDALKVQSNLLGANIAIGPRTQYKFIAKPAAPVAQNAWTDEIRFFMTPLGSLLKAKIKTESSSFDTYFYTRSGITIPSDEVFFYMTFGDNPHLTDIMGTTIMQEPGNFDCVFANTEQPQQPYIYAKILNKAAAPITEIFFDLEIGQL